MDEQAHKPHRKSKEKKKHDGGIFLPPLCSCALLIRVGPNPKAFAYATPRRLQKQAARSHDVA